MQNGNKTVKINNVPYVVQFRIAEYIAMFLKQGKVNKKELEPAMPPNVARYIYRMKQQTVKDFILCDFKGNYWINPKYSVELVEE